MKKLFMALVCLMTIVVLTSCGNINKDVEDAAKQIEMFSKQCVYNHSEQDVEYMFEMIMIKKKHVDTNDLVNNFVKDMNTACAKCFDPIFEKYGDRKALEALNAYINTQTYKQVKVSSKDELYEAIVGSAVKEYSELLKCKGELKIAEYKAKMLSEKL